VNIIYKVSSPHGYAFVDTYENAYKSMLETYPEANIGMIPIEQRDKTIKSFNRIDKGWFLIEKIEVKDTPQRLMPYTKV